ncbi:fam-l protein [Plasmodium malariae]|uniref:Fam-l protein n=1 Tax=Plasmodium malariae TaxID=5858 RepID=A0A1D3SMA6_PLAMA|nr:fam-l protein [Plasmodium malariae]SCO92866.1 fam-l protein [Plasmodium malariae]
MEQKIKVLLLIKIASIVLLTWICHFHVNKYSEFNRYLDENYKCQIMLLQGTYRLLAKYEQNKDSCTVKLRIDLSNDEMSKKKYIFNNEKKNSEKIKQANGSSLYNASDSQQDMKNKSCIYETKRYSYLEKKIFKELDFLDYLKKNKTISNKVYRKIMSKKCGLRIALPLIFFLLLSIVPILDCSLSTENSAWFFDLLGLDKLTELKSALSSLYTYLEWTKKTKTTINVNQYGDFVLMKLFDFILYVIPFFILGFIFILIILYYHKKVKKYEKVKFRKR